MWNRNTRNPLLLVGESFSPWTKKARWALEYCEVRFDYREYTPTLSEAWLRWRLRQWSGPVSVPVLLSSAPPLRGSWEIARRANQLTADERLGDLKSLSNWDVLSESALAEGRTRVVRAMLDDQLALEEALPAVIPDPLRGRLRFLARDAARRLDRKYVHLLEPGAIRKALLATREGLEKSGNDYLLGRFSYADITMAVVLEVIAPVAETDPPLGPAMLRCWNDRTLADEFCDLIEWRNRLAFDPATSYSQFGDMAA